MDEKTFLEKMMGLLDLDEAPSLDDELGNFEEWDSLGFVSFLSMANKVSATRVPPDKVRAAKKLGDLFALVKKES